MNNVSDPEAYLKQWFLGASATEIKRDNMKEFFLWAFFNRDGSPGLDDDELEDYVLAFERLLGREMAEGRGSATCLRLTIDAVNMLHRSALWYFCVGFVDFLTCMRLHYYGFIFRRTAFPHFFMMFPLRPITLLRSNRSPARRLSYWFRPHTSRTRRPTVFIHGIGIGLYPYVKFLAEMDERLNHGRSNEDQVGIIVIELMPISFRITHPALRREEVCDEIGTIIKHHGFHSPVIISHSYGTVITTQLLKSSWLANQIGPIVLIDPVSILLHLPDVAHNFTRRKPRSANEFQLHYFASMDMGVSHSLSRCFFWSENILWKHDIGDRPIAVALAEDDLIVNTAAVRTYLTAHDDRAPSNRDAASKVESSKSLRQRQASPVIPQRSTGDLLRCASGPEFSETVVDHPKMAVGGSHCNEAWQPWGDSALIWFRHLDHAQVFDYAETRKPVIEVIDDYTSRSC